ncbi:MAG: hypothetical protein ACRCVJ_12485 [Clostridium sp.]|uniref:hypothetical protein n=1 Tax=Clostridium sp. TaxID=1506 RepID=UPI003F2A37A6
MILSFLCIGIVLGIILILFSFKIKKPKNIIMLLLISASIICISLYTDYHGTSLNSKIVDIYNNKMPIPYELAYKVTNDIKNINSLNDATHIVLNSQEIKHFELCDKYYIEDFLFIKITFYSKGDIYKFVSKILMIAFFILVGFLTMIYAKQTKGS